MSLIERFKLGSELKSTLSIGKLFQRFITRSAKKLDLHVTELLSVQCNALHGTEYKITLRRVSRCV